MVVMCKKWQVTSISIVTKFAPKLDLMYVDWCEKGP